METVRLLRWGLVAIVAGMVFGTTFTLAQPGPPGPPEPVAQEVTPDSPESAAETRDRIRARIRIMRAWRLTEVMELDEATAVRLFEHLDAFDTRLHAEQDQLGQLGRQLREGLEDAASDDAAIRSLVEEITATHLRIEELRVQMVRESGDFLDARQQAALMLFVPEFEREIQQLMREVRRGRAERSRGGRRGPDPGEEPPGSRRRRSPRRNGPDAGF